MGRFVPKHFSGTHVTVYFDGGKERIGAVGCNTEHEIVFVHGEYSADFHTNNVAEMAAAVKAVELAIAFSWES